MGGVRLQRRDALARNDDQVGGEQRRMFGKKRFKELLLSVQDKPVSEQKEPIYQALLDYQGSERRRDDVAVFGFQI